MPSRILREGILTSDRVNALSNPAEVFYRRLMSVVDDFGRFDARSVMLKVSCFPLRVDVVREADISRWIAECEKAGLIVLYAVGDKPYIQLLDFRQAARAKQSKFPAPSDEQLRSACNSDASHMRSGCVAHAPVFEVEVEDECGAPPTRAKRARREPKTALPAVFAVSERVAEWAARKGFAERLPEYLEAFIGKAKAGDYRYVNWDDAFMNSIREDWGKVRERKDAPIGGRSTRVSL